MTVEVTANVLDLTDTGTRRRLGITLADLLVPTDDWHSRMSAGVWSATHEIGRLAAADDRFDGILYPPYPWRRILRQQGKYNLAVFMDSVSPGMAQPKNSTVKLSVEDPHNVLKKLKLKL